MKDDLFQDLLDSVREGGAILRGEKEPARHTEIEEPDVPALRGEYGLSQQQFARLLGISVKTLQNWEQGRRRPHGPARVLLRVAAQHPEAILDTLKKAGQEGGLATVAGGWEGSEELRELIEEGLESGPATEFAEDAFEHLRNRAKDG